jgi:flagellar hook protein FlgE
MMRSMYSGVAGLKTHQTKMDVIGNNIANVNTVAYKSQSITFSELMYQTTQAASGANATTGTGGTNAKQIGLGVTTGAISTAITTAGATQTTGNPFDLRITGDSFFIVNDGTGNYFTKAGAFGVDGAGNLVMSSTGYNVMGWGVDPEDPNVIQKDTVKALRIMSSENMTSNPEATTLARMNGVLDKFNANVNSTDGAVVTLEFYDNLGYSYTARFSIKATDVNAGEYDMTLTDILDSDGNSIGTTGVKFGSGNTLTTKVVFDPAGGLLASVDGGGKSITLDLSKLPLGGTARGNFTAIQIDMSSSKMFDNDGQTTLSILPGDEDNLGKGKALGTMSGVSITNSGMIYATYTNGNTKLLGQIAVASFSNAMGLEKVGDNLYAATLNSGEFDGIGQDITSDGGSMSTGVLEMSNVDLSTEFTEMIVTQRGFQANSRIITTSDTLLEELINLKR